MEGYIKQKQRGGRARCPMEQHDYDDPLFADTPKKICSKCYTTKPMTEEFFVVNRSVNSGFGICRKCNIENMDKYNYRKKEERRRGRGDANNFMNHVKTQNPKLYKNIIEKHADIRRRMGDA